MRAQIKSFALTCILSSALLSEPFGSVALSQEGSHNSQLNLPTEVSQPVTLKVVETALNSDKDAYSKVLQIFVGNKDNCCTNRSPIAGHYKLDNGSITFSPLFEFSKGQIYVVREQITPLQDKDTYKLTEFIIQADANKAPKVTGIYPSGDFIPENTLRFYVYFSSPMKPHVAFDYIKLVNSNGKVDDAAFMKFKQELWNKDRTRLTVLMDPGRIKRGVSTNLDLGPALLAGYQYKIDVKQGWPAANGTAALESFEKSFSVSSGLRELPNQKSWDISIPTMGTREALEIAFKRPFDFGLLHTAIKVIDKHGEDISGQIVVHDNERSWHFVPSDNWGSKTIQIIVDSYLEDVAGNNFRELLDHTVENGTKNITKIAIPISLKS